MAATEERGEQQQTDGRNVGRIEEITGVVIEAVFPDELPEINHAITVAKPDTGEEQEGVSAGAEEAGARVRGPARGHRPWRPEPGW